MVNDVHVVLLAALLTLPDDKGTFIIISTLLEILRKDSYWRY